MSKKNGASQRTSSRSKTTKYEKREQIIIKLNLFVQSSLVLPRNIGYINYTKCYEYE